MPKVASVGVPVSSALAPRFIFYFLVVFCVFFAPGVTFVVLQSSEHRIFQNFSPSYSLMKQVTISSRIAQFASATSIGIGIWYWCSNAI
jgi:hypothetical protein